MEPNKEQCIEAFRTKYGLPVSEAEDLLGRMEPVHYSKGTCLVREGECHSYFYIIAEGIWRGSYLNEDGDDITLWFASRGECLFAVWCYVADSPSLISIEAMNDSVLYRISKPDLEAYFRQSVEAASLGRRLFERQFLEMESWMIRSTAFRARERYLRLLEDNPDLLLYVPLKYIASYLWVTPQSLSRIRAELAESGRRMIRSRS